MLCHESTAMDRSIRCMVEFLEIHSAGLTNVGALFGKKVAYPVQDQNKRPNDRGLLNFCN